jgi:hypothetical protein
LTSLLATKTFFDQIFLDKQDLTVPENRILAKFPRRALANYHAE